jgi:hypothetical protein
LAGQAHGASGRCAALAAGVRFFNPGDDGDTGEDGDASDAGDDALDKA